ncbi:MAG: molecular chaperone DnaJ, partial [Deltaproteobacteria bacterium]
MNDDSISDYYEDLQVSPNADQETLERIYRMLAKRYHPDNGCTGCMDK